MEGIPFMAIGNDELGEPMANGDVIRCPLCDNYHFVELARDAEGKQTDALMFFSCGADTRICGVSGRNIMHKFNYKQGGKTDENTAR